MSFPDSLVPSLQHGGIAVIPTDTLYGVVCSARLPEAVDKLYTLRGRDTHKPCIILLADISKLREFGIVVSESDAILLRTVWPGKVSVVFDCPDEDDQWTYLHRGTKTLSFRVPADEELRNLLRNTGPLLAPSANIQGQPPACTIQEAKNYFGDAVAIYGDGGRLESLPSTVVRLQSGVWQVLREGAVTLLH